MSQITLLLADDHKLIRESWAFLLNSDQRFHVIAETGDSAQAIEMANKLKPHVVLMDINITPVDGFAATKLIRSSSPCPKIIGISMHSMPAYVKRMLEAGASGYVTKNSSRDEMITAILEVHRGNKYICEEVKNILTARELNKGAESRPGMNVLTSRELEIIQCIRNGASSKEISRTMNISARTVDVHRYNILKKLTLPNTASLVNYVNEWGL